MSPLPPSPRLRSAGRGSVGIFSFPCYNCITPSGLRFPLLILINEMFVSSCLSRHMRGVDAKVNYQGRRRTTSVVSKDNNATPSTFAKATVDKSDLGFLLFFLKVEMLKKKPRSKLAAGSLPIRLTNEKLYFISRSFYFKATPFPYTPLFPVSTLSHKQLRLTGCHAG